MREVDTGVNPPPGVPSCFRRPPVLLQRPERKSSAFNRSWLSSFAGVRAGPSNPCLPPTDKHDLVSWPLSYPPQQQHVPSPYINAVLTLQSSWHWVPFSLLGCHFLRLSLLPTDPPRKKCAETKATTVGAEGILPLAQCQRNPTHTYVDTENTCRLAQRAYKGRHPVPQKWRCFLRQDVPYHVCLPVCFA